MEPTYNDEESFDDDSQYDDEPELTWEEKVQDFVDEMNDLGVDLNSWK